MFSCRLIDLIEIGISSTLILAACRLRVWTQFSGQPIFKAGSVCSLLHVIRRIR